MTRILNEDDQYNDLAAQIAQEVREAVNPIITKYITQGYSVADLQYVIYNEISTSCVFEKTKHQLLKQQGKRN